MDNTKYIALVASDGFVEADGHCFQQHGQHEHFRLQAGRRDICFVSDADQKCRGVRQGSRLFTQDFGMYKDFKEGAIVHTGNTFDLALQGDAFFAIETPEGERYTRKGQFQLDADGQLVTSEGYAVMSENNEPFFIAPGETEISVAENGEVFTENGVIGRIKTVSFANNQKLLKVADTMFENTAGNMMQPAANAKVVQGAVEKSNVDPITEMTKMIKLQRSYEMVQSMIDEEHDRISNTISTYSQLA